MRSTLPDGLTALAIACAAVTAQTDIVIRPPLVPIQVSPADIRATDLRIVAAIQDGIATTELRQTIRNDGGSQAEATWLLPLPNGATADRFTMVVGGKEMPADLLDANQARAIYEDIVRRMRDPGLLEYVGDGCLRARVFPIPPKGAIDVLVRYRQVLPHTSGLHAYEFPLRAAGLPGRPADRLTLDLTIRSGKAIKNVYSPLAGVDIVRKSDHEARASLEISGARLPERDLTVFYGVSENAFGLDLLPWRRAGEPGHFLLMVSPSSDWPAPKNTVRVVQFVLDTSGSMQGKKIEQARNALRFFVASLGSADRFNIVPFSTEARPFFESPVVANEDNLAVARRKIDELEARGGTNIEDALMRALAIDPPAVESGLSVLPITVFLTDGQPTVGVTGIEELLAAVSKHNRQRGRIFVFGVGDDVNTRLLDKMASATNGDRDYVREHEDIELKTGALFTKLSNPVMTDVTLAFDGVEVVDVHPSRQPDLFKGSRLMVLGRYRGAGHHAIRLRGTVDGQTREYVYEASFPEHATEHDFVGTLWAQHKVAVLLDAIRMNGESAELRSEVQRLGREYGIVTPFTSHLIVEEGMRLARSRGIDAPVGSPQGFFLGAAPTVRLTEELRRAGAIGADGIEWNSAIGAATTESADAADRLARLPRPEATGRAAVDDSLVVLSLRTATTEGTRDGAGVGLIARRIGPRTFYLAGGVWIDRDYSASMRGHERKVSAYSDDYFALIREHPDLAKVFAFSSRIVVVVDGQAIEVE